MSLAQDVQAKDDVILSGNVLQLPGNSSICGSCRVAKPANDPAYILVNKVDLVNDGAKALIGQNELSPRYPPSVVR